jgi:MoxR-like ATPase
VRDRVRARVVGRERELDLILAAVAAGRDLLLEGPPGTSKSTLLRAITAEWGIPLMFVEGNADLTPAKLVGHHNPARVLREDYSAGNFVDGPLLQAMRAGGFLYVEEFNRAPEDTLNTLLTAMAERQIAVPRAGSVTAAPTFRVVASLNPYDNIGTTRLSTSVHDRLCRLAIGYQDEPSERGIVALRALLPEVKPAQAERLAADAVAVTRATRDHPDIRQGSSVRGAIDLTLVAGQLLGLGDVSPGDEERYRDVVFDAMIVALSGRIFLDETADSTPEQVLRQVWEDHFLLGPAAADPG